MEKNTKKKNTKRKFILFVRLCDVVTFSEQFSTETVVSKETAGCRAVPTPWQQFILRRSLLMNCLLLSEMIITSAKMLFQQVWAYPHLLSTTPTPRYPASTACACASLWEGTGRSTGRLWRRKKRAETSDTSKKKVRLLKGGHRLLEIFILKGRFAHVRLFPRAAGLARAMHQIALMTASGVNRAIYPGCLMATDDFVCVTCRVAGIRRCAMRTKGRADGLGTKLHKPRSTISPQL